MILWNTRCGSSLPVDFLGGVSSWRSLCGMDLSPLHCFLCRSEYVGTMDFNILPGNICLSEARMCTSPTLSTMRQCSPSHMAISSNTQSPQTGSECFSCSANSSNSGGPQPQHLTKTMTSTLLQLYQFNLKTIYSTLLVFWALPWGSYAQSPL